MKTKLLWLCAAGLLLALSKAPAATLYVNAASTNAVPPFTDWATAAAAIQDAVDVAAAGDEIVVTNGVYQTGARAVYGMSNRVAVTKAVMVRSVNGPVATTIAGFGPIGPAAVRCVYLTNGAVLAGLTLTNGATQTSGDVVANLSGGGVWCEGASAIVSNCVLTGNSADASGGGAYSGTLNNCTITENSAGENGGGGGASASTLNNCTLRHNSADPGSGGGANNCALNNCALTNNTGNGGGGANGSTLNNCTLTGNSANSNWSDESSGGGAAGSTLTNCTLTGNSAAGGGGVIGSILVNCTLTGNAAGGGGGAAGSTLSNCIITGNWAFDGGGGGTHGSTLNNCTIANNSADLGGGVVFGTLTNCVITGNTALDYYGGGAFAATLVNCTVMGNSASVDYSYGVGGGGYSCSFFNSIIYNNTAKNGANYAGGEFNYSCTTPAPGSGVGNITNAPLFLDTNGWSNLRLQSNSPCINAGNNSYLTDSNFTNSFDLVGNPRISGGTVDIGAYEFQSPASTISYAWLQQFGLPTDGSADYVDTDNDGHNNWQEWMAGTDPINALSVLRLASPLMTPTNVTLTWTSVTNRTYTLEQATNLGGAPAFSVLSSNLAGLPGTTSWTDTNAPVSSPRFYRLRVSP